VGTPERLKSTPGAPFAQDDSAIESFAIPPIRKVREWMGHGAFVGRECLSATSSRGLISKNKMET
jgi:hypothetical protein